MRKIGLYECVVDFNECYIGKSEYRKFIEICTKDILYLTGFYNENKKLLCNSFWNNIPKDEFIKQVRSAASQIFITLKNAYENDNLDQIFQPLSNNEMNISSRLLQSKAKFDR